MIRSLLLAFTLVAASMLNVAPASADAKGDTVGSALRALQATKARGGDVTGAASDALLDVTRNERVMVDVFVTGSLPDAVARLEANGMQVLATSERPLLVVSGRLGLVRLDSVAALDFVRGIQPVVGGGTDDWPGTKGTQGDTAHRGPAARALGGGNPLVRGKGVKVGIISDTIDSVGGGIADSVASGNLPAGRVVSLQEDPDPFVVDEGRAMAEIVYDTVPGVEQIVFSSGTVSAAGKAASINALVNQGVKVIGDDIFWLSEPFFQDGQVAQAVNNARAAGVTYFASAGNRARQSWEGTYTDSGGFHNFAGGDTTQSIVSVPDGSTIRVALQWNEPWGAATTDIDAFLTRQDGTALPGATSGGTDDNLSGRPAAVRVRVMVEQHRGSNHCGPAHPEVRRIRDADLEVHRPWCGHLHDRRARDQLRHHQPGCRLGARFDRCGCSRRSRPGSGRRSRRTVPEDSRPDCATRTAWPCRNRWCCKNHNLRQQTVSPPRSRTSRCSTAQVPRSHRRSASRR